MIERNRSIQWVVQRRLFGFNIGSPRPIQGQVELVAPPSLPLRGCQVVAHVIFDSEGGQALQMLGRLPGQSMPQIDTVYTPAGLQNIYAEAVGQEGRRDSVPRVVEQGWKEKIGFTKVAPQIVTYR